MLNSSSRHSNEHCCFSDLIAPQICLYNYSNPTISSPFQSFKFQHPQTSHCNGTTQMASKPTLVFRQSQKKTKKKKRQLCLRSPTVKRSDDAETFAYHRDLEAEPFTPPRLSASVSIMSTSNGHLAVSTQVRAWGAWVRAWLMRGLPGTGARAWEREGDVCAGVAPEK